MQQRSGIKRTGAVLLALALMLAVLWLPGRAPAASDTQYIRVLLSTEGAGTLSVPVSGSYTLLEANRAFTNGELTISASGGTVTVSHSSEGLLYSGRSVTLERASLARSAGSLTIRTAAGTRQYLGHFSIRSENGALQVVNRVPLSHYLYGVVAYEMSDDFPLEALRAQAVAAKGYALLHIRSTGHYDIGDTASDQVYRGYNAAYTNVISAVDTTANDVLYYNGRVLQCYYAASNGGWAILPGTRWSSKAYDGAFFSGADPYDMKNPSTPRELLFIPANYSEREMDTAARAFIDARLMAAAGAPGLIPENYRFAGVKSIDAVTASGEAGYKGDMDYTTVTVQATLTAVLVDEAVPSPTPSHAPTPSPTPEPVPAPTAEPTAAPEAAQPEDSAAPTAEPGPTEEPTPSPSPTPSHAPTPSPPPEPELTRDIPLSFSFLF
ncbi:MAG: SpoIID/LytB domain-containing protein, partial [Clostridia bacterium]|nr:SpoIID/LytB domain-containing protein [Clostridia bacterium]